MTKDHLSSFVCGLCVVLFFLASCHLQKQPEVLKEADRESLVDTPAGPKVNFKKPGILKTYKAYYVEPVRMYAIDSGKFQPASSVELDRLATKFRSKIIRALGDKHTLFNQPARDVAILRIAITNVWSTRTLLNLRPGFIVPNAVSGGASMEAQVIDSVTNEKVGFVTDSRSGARKGYMSGLTKWGGTESAFDEWAEMLRHSIDEGSY
jgi:hypothetical protein